ncbi:hypothetical protein C4D60_Mb05t17820 [Musa balbisiana]|uniref:Uncharacterized protein n=1 Tax=Musa balbisiana TaxID=52838 RepID=A0A4S8JWX3_MUSBA|nr:hypothetical protein C4D60_Mb05t17820 [Musa balbisiana]
MTSVMVFTPLALGSDHTISFPMGSGVAKLLTLSGGICSPTTMVEAEDERMTPRYLTECRGAGIKPSWTLFLACFRLCKGQGEYYLTACSDFKISDAPSNNKGWKKHFFFVNCSQEWGFSTGWAFQTIDNISPSLSAGETTDVDRLRDGGSSIGEEDARRQGRCAPISGWGGFWRWGCPLGGHTKEGVVVSGSGSPSEKDEDLGPEDAFRPSCWHERRPGLPGATSQGEDSGNMKGNWSVGSSGGDPSRRVPVHPTLIRELCRVYSRAKGEQYQALNMADLSVGEPGTPYITRWATLKADNRIWGNGPTTQEFIRGALHLAIAKDLYCSSEVLVEQAAKSLVWSDTYAALRLENLELRARVGSEAIAAAKEHASTLGEEVGHLKTKLEESWTRIRSLDDELLTLSHNVEVAKSSAWAIEEVLKEEQLVLPKKVEEAIAAYKASTGFKHGLVRLGWATYEFEYRVACAHFWEKYLDLELESDPFVDHPMDQDVDMSMSIPFDDRPETLPPR